MTTPTREQVVQLAKEADLEVENAELTARLRLSEALRVSDMAELESLRKDAVRWKAIVAESERDYVEVPSHEEPWWKRLECTEAMEEWADAAIAAAPKEK